MNDSASKIVARSGAPTWRYAMAAATTATIQASDPTMATMPGSPTITLSPKLWIASATAGRWRTGASLPCCTSAPMASPITLSQAA
jgi:hypothetical protein